MHRKLSRVLAAMSAVVLVMASGCQPNTSATPKAVSTIAASGSGA